MSLIRVLRTAAATLTRTFYSDEMLTDPSSTMTVSVARLDGTVVATGLATDMPGTGVFTYTLSGGPAGVTAQLDHLNVTWTAIFAGASMTWPPDRVEVVGGFLFGLAEARASDSSLADPVRYPTATLADKRVEVEQECERICGWAFVPRFGRAVLSGNGDNVLALPALQVRTLRSVSTRIQPGGVLAAVSPLTEVSVSPTGYVTRYDGGYFPAGVGNVVMEFEHGFDQPPEDLKEAAMYRLRSRLNLTRSGVPDRVSSYTTPEGSVYRVTLPSRGSTGIPDVDAVYQAYQAPPLGFA